MSTGLPAEVLRRDREQTFRIWAQMEPMFRWGKRAIGIAAVLAFLFIALEAVRMYQTLAGIHP